MGKLSSFSFLVLVLSGAIAASSARATPACNCTPDGVMNKYYGCQGGSIFSQIDPTASAACIPTTPSCAVEQHSAYCPSMSPASKPDCNAMTTATEELKVGCQAQTPQTCAGASRECNIVPVSCYLEILGGASGNFDSYCPNFGEAPPATATATSTSTSTSTNTATAEAEAKRRKAAEEEQKRLEAETLAKQKALEEELAKKGNAAIESQKSALGAADDISLTGMNQAANIGAIWCAHGANAHLNDKDLAEQSFGTCKDYLGAADALRTQRGRNETFALDSDTISGEWASGILGDFEKNFGVAAGDFMSRLLGSSDLSGDLSDMTKGKIKEGELAEAYANGKGKGEFELAIGGKGGAGKKGSVRDDLKKALAAEAKRKLASEKKGENLAAAVDKRKEKDSIEGLKAMGAGEAFGIQEMQELSIFQVVHRKYQEIFRERRKL